MSRNITAGETVKAYGHEWEVLDTDYNGGILCLMKEQICEKSFDEDGCNYYPESDICAYLAELTEEFEAKGASFETANLSMRADDGTGWDKDNYEATGLFLLTADLYREYRRYISDKAHWWWLATAYSFSSGYSNSARFVYTDGSLNTNSAYSGNYGVAPACIFSFLPDEEETKPGAETQMDEVVESVKQLVRDLKAIRERISGIEDRLDELED